MPIRCLIGTGGANLVVISLGHNLLASRSKHDGVLILRRVAALDIAKRRVGLNNTHIAKIFQCPHVFFLLSVVAILSTFITSSYCSTVSSPGFGV